MENLTYSGQEMMKSGVYVANDPPTNETKEAAKATEDIGVAASKAQKHGIIRQCS